MAKRFFHRLHPPKISKLTIFIIVFAIASALTGALEAQDKKEAEWTLLKRPELRMAQSTPQKPGENIPPAVQSPEPKVSLEKLSKQPPHSPEMLRMEMVFVNRCSSCHNDTADGHGPWSHSMRPPEPANLTMLRQTPSMARSIIINGVPGTMMPEHSDLDSSTIDGLLAYIATKPKNTKIQWDLPWSITDVTDPITGQQLFVTYCQGCHGAEADGNSKFAQNALVWPKPANLKARNSDIGRVYFLVTQGRHGTMMTAQITKLPELSRWLLAQYATSLFDATSTATIQVPRGTLPTLANKYIVGDQKIIQQGEALYNLYCSACHSEKGEGSFQAPMLCDRIWFIGDGTDTALMAILQEGVPGKLMIATSPQLSDDQRWQVITYIRYRSGWPDPMTSLYGDIQPDQMKNLLLKGAGK